MKLYGVAISPYVRKVAVILELKGLDYESIAVMPGQLPEGYRRLSPLGKIPALEDGDTAMADSSVICEYLEEQYPEVPVLPASPAERARSRWLEEYADSKMTELLGGLFFERMVKFALIGEPTDEQRVAAIIDKQLPPVLDYVESQVPEQGFFFGDRLGTADISVVSPTLNAALAGYTIDAERWPKLAAFIERVKAHPALAKPLAAEATALQSLAG